MGTETLERRLLPRELPEEAPRPRDNRLTKLKRTRESWDHIIAAYYHHHNPKLGIRRLAKLFDLPQSTIKSILDRTPQHHPEVKGAAIRFQLLRPVSLDNLPGSVNVELLDNLLKGGDYPKRRRRKRPVSGAAP